MSKPLRGLRIASATRNEHDRLVIRYDAAHQNNKTVLELGFTLVIDEVYGTSRVELSMQTDDRDTPDEALDLFADWLDRLSKAVRERTRDGIVIPSCQKDQVVRTKDKT